MIYIIIAILSAVLVASTICICSKAGADDGIAKYDNE